MQIFQTKTLKLPGTDIGEVQQNAWNIYREIKRRSKRKPYIRSAYFQKDKIFLELFWIHLFQKLNHKDKLRRLKYFPCGLELIKNSRLDPVSKQNPNKSSEILHRFIGQTKNGEIFYVQVKEDIRKGQKWLMSIFPARQ